MSPAVWFSVTYRRALKCLNVTIADDGVVIDHPLCSGSCSRSHFPESINVHPRQESTTTAPTSTVLGVRDGKDFSVNVLAGVDLPKSGLTVRR